MPILNPQSDIFPTELLDEEFCSKWPQRQWWCIYTRSRHEKKLSRQLTNQQIPHYCPLVNKRYRSPKGRMRTVSMPLFPNYVFLFASEEERYQTLTTNAVSRITQVEHFSELVADLRQIHVAIRANVPLTPEARIVAGQTVRVRTGPFRGYDGIVLRREGKTRLLLAVRFLEQGASMEIDEGLLEIRD
jgi:transcription antitermination factor NusG